MLHVAQRILDFHSVGGAVAFEDEVQVVRRICPGPTFVRSGVSTSHEKASLRKPLKEKSFPIETYGAADTRIRILLNESHELVRLPSVIPIFRMPQEMNGLPGAHRPDFIADLAPTNEVVECPSRHPMEPLILEQDLHLAGEEDVFPILVEVCPESVSSVSLPGISDAWNAASPVHGLEAYTLEVTQCGNR